MNRTNKEFIPQKELLTLRAAVLELLQSFTSQAQNPVFKDGEFCIHVDFPNNNCSTAFQKALHKIVGKNGEGAYWTTIFNASERIDGGWQSIEKSASYFFDETEQDTLAKIANFTTDELAQALDAALKQNFTTRNAQPASRAA